MLDIGWSELLVLGALALIVVGPKDLPRMLRTAGQWVGKMKSMAREFQRSMNDAAREADVADIKELKSLKSDLEGINSEFRRQANVSALATKSSPKPASKAAEAKPAAKPVEAASGNAGAGATAASVADPKPASAPDPAPSSAPSPAATDSAPASPASGAAGADASKA